MPTAAPTTALVIVDVQNDFLEGGALAVTGGRAVAHLLANPTLLRGYDTIYTTQDWHIDPGDHFTTWPVHCVAATPGAAIETTLRDALTQAGNLTGQVLKGEYADAYSGAQGHDVLNDDLPLLDSLARAGVTQVDVVGLALDYCVKATALDLAAHGLTVRVLTRYTASVDPGNEEAVTAELVAAGVQVER